MRQQNFLQSPIYQEFWNDFLFKYENINLITFLSICTARAISPWIAGVIQLTLLVYLHKYMNSDMSDLEVKAQ